MPTSNDKQARSPQGVEIHVRDDDPSPPEDNALTRRTALKMFSASALLSMGVGCTRKPKRHIVSMVDRPEYQEPGKALYYASTWNEGLRPYGMMVKAIDGRPIKIEGLPGHPLNDGRSHAPMQASLLGLYDPNRVRTPMRGEDEATWEAADAEIVAALKKARSVVVVTRAGLGPSERAMTRHFGEAVPAAKFFVHEPAGDPERRATWKAVYGIGGVLEPKLANARVILSIDSDFLQTDGDTIRAMRDFAATRKVKDASGNSLSRLYVAESAMTVTGSNADHRIPLRPSQALAFVEALRAAVTPEGTATSGPEGMDKKVLAALVADLKGNRGKAVVLAGPHLPAAVHASVALINDALGAADQTLEWNPLPPNLPVNEPADIAAALKAAPDVAIFLGVNPVYDGLGEAAAAAKMTVGHGLTRNETLAACTIALPSAHNLESWNDAVPTLGMRSVCQPLIAPLFGGRQELESLLVWTKALKPGGPLAKLKDAYDVVKAAWREGPWDDALRAGVVGTPRAGRFPSLERAKAQALAAGGAQGGGTGPVDVVVLPHACVYDGRYTGLSWLIELPEPTSKLVWDNAAVMSPATAKALDTSEGRYLKIENGVELPVLVQAGVAPNTIVAHMGYGRTNGAGTGNDIGVNVAPLAAAAGARIIAGAQVAKTHRAKHNMVRSQYTFDQQGRHLAASGTREEYAKDNAFVKHRNHVPELVQIDEPWDYSKGHKWGLAIDLNACTGCESCVIACQAENNIPAVGKDECQNGRDMSWIRLDRYESGSDANPVVDQQPMLCQQCDNAPCESVCPVNATSHTPEGLNDQIYNRCVGTRYCGNNCPYKVRRFNFLNYTRKIVQEPVQELLYNPNVTVRMRGVMEKCTFCVQRINAAKFEASNKGETLPDGAITPACQQACAADAIVFGDVNLKDSAIQKARASSLAYHVLEELNVRPNVTYLAKVRNPNPNANGSHTSGGGH